MQQKDANDDANVNANVDANVDANDSAGEAGVLLFAIVFLGVSVLLLALIGNETKFDANGKLFSQPRTWPAISIAAMVLFGAAFLTKTKTNKISGAINEIFLWVKSTEYLIWFMIYVISVPVIGYITATIIFTGTLARRAGYKNPKAIIAAVVAGIIIVITFKTVLDVKIPGGQIYEILPNNMRNFAIVNL